MLCAEVSSELSFVYFKILILLVVVSLVYLNFWGLMGIWFGHEGRIWFEFLELFDLCIFMVPLACLDYDAKWVLFRFLVNEFC